MKSRNVTDVADATATKGGANIFADLGFKDAPELLAKAELTRQICSTLRARKLTHRQAAGVLGIAHPDVTALMNGRTTSFSIDRLMKLLMRLDNDVEIVVRPRPRTRKESRLSVKAA
jgi:predicted XRE-type DNA-binding protein